MTDSSLLLALQNDDEAALKLVYERYWDPMFKKACKRVGREEASDLIQNVIISFWKRRHQISPEKKDAVSRYLFTALKYNIISHYAYTSSSIKRACLLENSHQPSPDDLLERKELRMILEKAIEEMPGKMQLIFRMSREEDVPIAQIAVYLNISEQTVKNQLVHATKKLRVQLHTTSGLYRIIFLLTLIS